MLSSARRQPEKHSHNGENLARLEPQRRTNHGNSVPLANDAVGVSPVRPRGCDVMGTAGVASAGGTDNRQQGGIFPFAHHGLFHAHPGPVGQVQVIASGLNQPKKITVAPDGSLLVALSGDAVAPASCTDGAEPSCLDNSGAIVRVTPGGHVSTVSATCHRSRPAVGARSPVRQRPPARWRPSFNTAACKCCSKTPASTPRPGKETYGPAGTLLGDLVRFPLFGSAAPKSKQPSVPSKRPTTPIMVKGRPCSSASRPSTQIHTPSFRTEAAMPWPTQPGTTCSTCRPPDRSRCWPFFRPSLRPRPRIARSRPDHASTRRRPARSHGRGRRARWCALCRRARG